ncbi:MAG: XRE family transcriptional regulator [Eubacteriales bacterium]
MENGNKGEVNIGLKIRRLRKIRNLSLQQVSEETGMSYSYLSGLENDKHSISIVNLQRLAKYFGVDLIHFLDNRDTNTVLIRKGDGQEFATEDGIVFNVITSKKANHLQVSYVTLPPHSPAEKNIHKHEQGEELIVALEGEAVVVVEDEKYRLNQGDSVLFSSEVEHLIYTEDSVAKIIIVSSPPYGRDVIPGGSRADE